MTKPAIQGMKHSLKYPSWILVINDKTIERTNFYHVLFKESSPQGSVDINYEPYLQLFKMMSTSSF